MEPCVKATNCKVFELKYITWKILCEYIKEQKPLIFVEILCTVIPVWNIKISPFEFPMVLQCHFLYCFTINICH